MSPTETERYSMTSNSSATSFQVLHECLHAGERIGTLGHGMTPRQRRAVGID